jgi:hypothetical protein
MYIYHIYVYLFIYIYIHIHTQIDIYPLRIVLGSSSPPTLRPPGE